MLYNLRLRLSFISPKPHNARPYSDSEVRERILELRAKGHTLRQIASILNEQGWIPLKGRCFTERNIHGLLRTSDATKVLTPKRYLQMMLTKMERAHTQENPGEPFEPPSLAELARILTEAGYKTPRGKQFFQCRARHRLHWPDPAASSRPDTVSPRHIAPAASFAAHASDGSVRNEDLQRWPMYWGAVSKISRALLPIHRKELFPATTEEVAEPFDIGGVRDGELSVSGGIHDEQAR